MSKIKRVLVSQPAPADPTKSPYYSVAKNNDVEIDFKSFIRIEGVDAKTFRKQRVDILSYSAIVLTSKYAIDHFFRLCNELRVSVPETMKYFCISESVAVYLQKYVVYRKRKVFFGAGKFNELTDIMKKHKEEKYLVPLSGAHNDEIPEQLAASNLDYKIAIFYNTVSSDLSDTDITKYDMLIFFSPQGIASLNQNFPDFKQGEVAIGAFGPLAAKAVSDAGLRLDVAPTPETPSMAAAVDAYIKKVNAE